MTKRISLFDIPIDALTMQETIDKIDASISNGIRLHHVVVNAAKIVNAQSNPELYESIVNSDIINADGQAVVWASKILRSELPERVTGIDLMENLIELASIKKYSIFFLGAKEEVVKKVVDYYEKLYGQEIIAGFRNGYFSIEEEDIIAKKIAFLKPDILFVAMSSPKKENFLNNYKSIIKAPFIMGVGGSFDVVSGLTKRAPKWMQKNGLEWFYRFLQEPSRMWKRYLVTNSIFIWMIFKEKQKLLFKKNN